MFTSGNVSSTRTGDDRNRPGGLSSHIFLFAFTLLVVGLALGVDAQTIPNPPSNLVAGVISPAQINLSWSDASTNESGFKVERSLDGISFTQVAQVLSNVTSYRNAGLFPSKTYSYRLRAYNAGGNSTYSGVATAGTPALCPTAVVGWGNNSDSELVMPPGLTNVVAISAGDYHNLALKSDGTVVAWGYNCCGQTSPQAGLTGVVAVAAGGFHSLALKSDGTVVGWGYNGNGQTSPPGGLSGVVAIAAGDYHSLALKSDGTVVGWGENSYGESTAPGSLAGVVAIAAGYDFSVALRSDGTVFAWGYNCCGEGSSPVSVTNAVAIAAGLYHGLALKSDGTVLGWGYYGSGATSPPADLTNAVALGAGYLHSLAVRSDGTVVGWGDSTDGDLIPPAGLAGVSAIDGGVQYSLALTTGLLPPAGLTASVFSPNQVNLVWGYTAGNQDGFDIERAPDSGGSPGTWTQVATVGTNIMAYPDTGLTTNTTYWYRVRAYNTCVESPYSLQVSVVTAPPPAPLNLTALVGNTNQVNLSWSSTYSDETGFKIERALDNGGSPGTWAQVATVGSGVTAYADTGRALNTTYWYRVRAYNPLGDSPYSNLASATPSSGQLITVMQWNVEGHIGSVFSNNTAQARAIARIVNYNQPDILLFCELEDHGDSGDTAGLIDWVTNNVPYLGSQTGSTFYVAVAVTSDGYERNGAISRFPISNKVTYSDGLRGLHAFQIRLNGVPALQIYHAHLKCCSDGTSCDRKQSEAQIDAAIISGVAATSPLPYVFAGDWNEDEENPECTLSGIYHPITTIREGGGLVEFKPTTLGGEYRTWSTDSGGPSIRFDYILAATNRLNPSAGYVFSTMDWANHGLYTNASPQNLVNDSRTASDHYNVFAKYFLPTPYFTVTPTNSFASTGYLGGPFSPVSRVYTLSNTNSAPLSWGVGHLANWLDLSATNGTLPAGASTNITASINSVANALPVGAYTDAISFTDAVTRASMVLNVNLTILWPPPVASFTGNPRVGPAPLTVTFSDTSTGNISGRFWDFGDGSTANVNTDSVVHTYAAGNYTVTQIESGPGGSTTNIQPNYITALSPFQMWQIQYFGSTNNPAAAPTADADGTGQNNLFKFLAGLDPTNPASIFWITSVSREGNDLRVTWSCVGGHTYALQGTTWGARAGYTNAFFDISPAITAAGVGESTTNFLVAGALTRPGSAPPSGQAVHPVAGPAPQSPSTQLRVEATAWNTRALVDAYGNPVAMSNLVVFGTFSIDEPTIRSNFNTGNIGAILSAFTQCGPAFAVGDGTGVPATWDDIVDGTSFIGRQMYMVAVDQPTVDGATQLGIFTGPSWVLAGGSTYTNLDLETATDFVIGTPGGSLTMDWGGPYTFTDTAQLAAIPVVHHFYRVRVVQ